MFTTRLRSRDFGAQDNPDAGVEMWTNDRGHTFVGTTWNDRGFRTYANVPAETVTVEVVK